MVMGGTASQDGNLAQLSKVSIQTFSISAATSIASSLAAARNHILLTFLSMSAITNHLPNTALVKPKLDLTLRNLHITLTSQVESITVLCFAVHLETRGRWTRATTNVEEFTHFHFELVKRDKISLVFIDLQTFLVQSFQFILNSFLIQQRND